MGKAPGSILHFVGGYLVGSQSKHKLLSYQKPIAITIFIIIHNYKVSSNSSSGEEKKIFFYYWDGRGGGVTKI